MKGQVRIIGGRLRGRKLPVLTGGTIRPTPDRVRETLFNWLAPVIQGAHCLDAFAGTGVIGMEALSRGAASVLFVDQSAEVVRQLETSLKRFELSNATVMQAHMPKLLEKVVAPFDIVFLDPPFQEALLIKTCYFLEENHLLAPVAYIYLETKTPIQPHDLPIHWKLLKSKKAGLVAFHLVKREVVKEV